MTRSLLRRGLCLSVFIANPLLGMPLAQDPSEGDHTVRQVSALANEERCSKTSALKSQLMLSFASWVEQNKSSTSFKLSQHAEFFVFFALLYQASLTTGSQERENKLLYHDFMQLIDPIGPQIAEGTKNRPTSLDLQEAARRIFEGLDTTDGLVSFIDAHFHTLHQSKMTKGDYEKKLLRDASEIQRSSLRKCRETLVKQLLQDPLRLYPSYFADCLGGWYLFCHPHNHSFFLTITSFDQNKIKTALPGYIPFFTIGNEPFVLEDGVMSEKNALYFCSQNGHTVLSFFVRDDNAKTGFVLSKTFVENDKSYPALRLFETVKRSCGVECFLIPDNFSDEQKAAIREDENFGKICNLLLVELERLTALEEKMQDILEAREALREAEEEKKQQQQKNEERRKESNRKKREQKKRKKAAELTVTLKNSETESSDEIFKNNGAICERPTEADTVLIEGDKNVVNNDDDDNEDMEEPTWSSPAFKTLKATAQKPSPALEAAGGNLKTEKYKEQFKKMNRQKGKSPSQFTKMLNILSKIVELREGNRAGSHGQFKIDGQSETLVPPHKGTKSCPLRLDATKN